MGDMPMKRAIVVAMVAGSLVVAAGCGNGGWAGPQEIVAKRGVVSAVRVAKGPVIDGTLQSKVWQKCPPLELGKCLSSEIGALKTHGRVLFDPTHLYVAFECFEPDTSKLKTAVTQRDGTVWNDDYVDLFVTGDPRTGSYHFLVNPVGTLLDARTGPDDSSEDTSWNSSAVVKTSTEKNKRWIVTLSVPLKELGARVGEDQTWPMNLNRTRPLGSNQFEESSWSPTGGSQYRDPAGWGKIIGVRIVSRPDGVTRTVEPPKKK
jgi:hypothetical protein